MCFFDITLFIRLKLLESSLWLNTNSLIILILASHKTKISTMLKIRYYLALFLLPILLFSCNENLNNPETTLDSVSQEVATEKPYAIVIHGGAGAMRPEMMTDSLEKAYRET